MIPGHQIVPQDDDNNSENVLFGPEEDSGNSSESVFLCEEEPFMRTYVMIEGIIVWLKLLAAFMGILVSHSAAYHLRNWLLAFILFELLKLYTQIQVYRAVRENELYLTGVSLRVRLFSFAVDNACFVWFLYGNFLYYNSDSHSEIGFVFSSLFCAILIYGYTYMVKYAIECVVICCVVPIWSCLSYIYPPIEPSSNLSEV